MQISNVTEVCERCPTGALTYQRKGSAEAETAAATNTVMVANHGPLYVKGDLEIAGAADDMTGVRFRAALCRCGHSKIKPFCDNSHEDVSFRDHAACGETGAPLTATGGTLEVKRAPNGPLLVTGNLTILSGSGRPAWQGTKAALCRCGHSGNKPFCDGAHIDIGFESD